MATNDFLGNKTLAKQGILDGNLSYYVISRPHLKAYAEQLATKDIVVIPPVDDIISCFFYPYMDIEEMITTEVDFDEEAYPLPYNEDCVRGLTLTRVNHVSGNGIRDIGTFSKYAVSNTSIGGTWKWQNEGKLWLPPFTTCLAYDGLTEPIEINPTLTPDENTFTICVRHSLNHLGAYTLYVDGYRGSSQGYLYGQTCTGLSFPILSNAYTTYMHENQFNLRAERFGKVTSFIANLGSKNLSGIANDIIGFGNTYIGEANAKLSGYQLSGDGSNALHDIQFLGGMQVVHQQYLDEYMEQIGTFFHFYGYAQNKLMTPNVKSRKNFNYLEGDINLNAVGIPKEHLNQLKQIYQNGVTIWHMSTSGNYIGNYLPDNTEV